MYKLIKVNNQKVHDVSNLRNIIIVINRMINLYFFLVKNLLYTVLSCCSVTKSCLTLQIHGLQHARLPGPSLSPRLLKFMSVESVMPSNHLIFCSSLLFLPSIFPSIRVFSNELALCQIVLIYTCKLLIIW